MTENKRFEQFQKGKNYRGHYGIKDNLTDKKYPVPSKNASKEIVELLNSLSNENEQLKSKLFDCNLELEHSKESVDDAYWELTEAKKENEQLKKQNLFLKRLHEGMNVRISKI